MSLKQGFIKNITVKSGGMEKFQLQDSILY